MILSQETVARDWKEPRSCRMMTAIAPQDGWPPSGVTLHCITNCGINCRDAENIKGHVSVTVVAIKDVGWGYAPWKKPKNAAVKLPKDPNAKKLAEVGEEVSAGGQRVIRSAKLYMFPREGKTDKGPRDEDSAFTIWVGETLHFGLQKFMFEDKKSHAVFPPDTDFIPPFTLVEIAFGSSALPAEPAHEGYGLRLECIRTLDFTPYSYLTPQGLGLLPPTFQAAGVEAVERSDASPSISKMVEIMDVAFFAEVQRHAYLAEVEGAEGWYRLLGREGQPVAEGLYEVDIREEDLLRYTNAGDHLGYARLVVDVAIAAGALRIYACRGEFFDRQERALTKFRAIPLVDTEKLLECVDVVLPQLILALVLLHALWLNLHVV